MISLHNCLGIDCLLSMGQDSQHPKSTLQAMTLKIQYVYCTIGIVTKLIYSSMDLSQSFSAL